MRILIILPMLMATVTPALAQETSGPKDPRPERSTQVTVLAGTDYIAGDIGNGRKYETVSASAGLAMTSGRFSIAASLPYISTSAPEELIISQGGLFGTPLLATPGTQTQNVRREGIGDLTVEAGYSLPVAGVEANIGASVKVPTASREKGLGTGKADYGVSGQLSKRMGSVIPFVGAGYKIVGQPDNFAVHNTVSGSAGGRVLLGSASSLTAAYSYEQSAVSGIGDNQSVGLGFGTNLSHNVRIGIDGAAGLSPDAPDAKVGLRIGIGL